MAWGGCECRFVSFGNLQMLLEVVGHRPRSIQHQKGVYVGISKPSQLICEHDEKTNLLKGDYQKQLVDKNIRKKVKSLQMSKIKLEIGDWNILLHINGDGKYNIINERKLEKSTLGCGPEQEQEQSNGCD